MNSAVHIRKVLVEMNRLRSQYNILRGMTIRQVISLHEAGERGDYADLQWLYRLVEKREATLRAVKRQRLSAICELPWQINTVAEEELPKGATQSQAEAQKIYLREVYDGIDNLYAAIKQLALAEFRGFSHLEIVPFGKGHPPTHLEPVEQWHWVRDGYYGDWKYDPRSQGNLYDASPIDPAQFIIRQVDDPINEIAALAYVRMALAERDWDGFMEVFGIPFIFLMAPEGTNPEQMEKFQELAEAAVGDMRATLPGGSSVEIGGGDVRGNAPFEARLKHLQEQVVLAGTSGLLTMLAESGSGTLAGGAHTETFERIAAAEAREISEIMQKQLDARLLEQRFPGQPSLAYFELAPMDEDDRSQVVQDALKLKQAGYKMDAGELSERTGYDLTEDTSQASELSIANNSEPREKADRAEEVQRRLLAKARLGLEEATIEDLKPLADRMAQIMELQDVDRMLAELEDLEKELPNWLRRINENPKAAIALEKSMGAASVNGIAEASNLAEKHILTPTLI